jgi:hypothetical protein
MLQQSPSSFTDKRRCKIQLNVCVFPRCCDRELRLGRRMQAPPSVHKQPAVIVPVVDTFDMSHTATVLRPPPAADAPAEEKMEFLQQQLDSIGMERPILNGLLLLGSGVKERLQGGVLPCT